MCFQVIKLLFNIHKIQDFWTDHHKNSWALCLIIFIFTYCVTSVGHRVEVFREVLFGAGFVLLLSQRFSPEVVLALSTLTVCVIACSDSTRGAYYKSISGRTWSKPHQYELSADNSIGPEKTAELIYGCNGHEETAGSLQLPAGYFVLFRFKQRPDTIFDICP